MSCKKSNKDEYSLWLIPEEPEYSKFSETINYLAEKYKCLKFSPHLTLIGKLFEDEKKAYVQTLRLSMLLKPFEVKLKGLNHFNEVYKCLFIEALETSELMNANRKAKEIFKKEFDYFPHMSLMYGEENLVPKKIKENIIQEVDNISLNFQVRRMDLYYTGRDLDSWYRVERFNLRN